MSDHMTFDCCDCEVTNIGPNSFEFDDILWTANPLILSSTNTIYDIAIRVHNAYHTGHLNSDVFAGVTGGTK